MTKVKERLRSIPFFVLLYRIYLTLKHQFRFNIFAAAVKLLHFGTEYYTFRSLQNNPHFAVRIWDVTPCLTDRTESTPIEPIYFYQDAWAAGKIFENKPAHHYDVGSSAKTIAIISQFVPTTMVDIRPIDLQLHNLFFTKGSILALPFDDNSIESISSLCVVEHIGLGRYGDPLDQFGSEKAIAELQRVTKPKGRILFSVPIGILDKVFFNGHRVFSREYLVSLFRNCVIAEEKYIVDNVLTDEFRESRDFTVGLYSLIKR